MNRFAPKSEFIRRRAISLYRSGVGQREVARQLGLARSTVQAWTAGEEKRPTIVKVLKQAQIAAAARWSGDELPTLAFVPQIKLTANSKYRMAPHG